MLSATSGASTDSLGDAGKRLHTGRSRNDQVATDIRLWLRDRIDEIDSLLRALQLALLTMAESNADTPLPGFTHLQVAQPPPTTSRSRRTRQSSMRTALVRMGNRYRLT